MKMLLPRERESFRQREQERLVTEETELTHRIGKLAELEQSEKKNLRDFQERELKKFQEEHSRRIDEIRHLDALIAAKRKGWDELLKPLDEEWRRKREKEEGRLAQKREKLAEQEKANRGESLRNTEKALSLQKEQDLFARQSEKEKEILKKEILRLAQEKKRLEESLADAERNRKETAQKLFDAESTLEAASLRLAEADTKLFQLSEREKDLEFREQEVLNREYIINSPVRKL